MASTAIPQTLMFVFENPSGISVGSQSSQTQQSDSQNLLRRQLNGTLPSIILKNPPPQHTIDKTQAAANLFFVARWKASQRTSKFVTPVDENNASAYFNILIENAYILFRENNYAAALDLCNHILSNWDLHQHATLYCKSSCLWKLGRLQEAKECLSDLLRFYPRHAESWARRGAISIQQCKYDEALADINRSFHLSKTGYFLEHRIFADCYGSFKETQNKALFLLHHIPVDSEGRSQIAQEDQHLLRGIFFASQDDYAAAIEELNKINPQKVSRLVQQTLQIFLCQWNSRGRPSKKIKFIPGVIPVSLLLDS
jgi:tetratricopeptide (TPR) repeat protein